MDNLSFGQRIDQENGLCELWLTHGALDWIKQQDWSDKNILMYGAGLGDAWLASKCKTLTVIERRGEWVRCGAKNLVHVIRPCDDCSGKNEYYLEFPEGVKPDIIINDDAYRYEVCVMAEKYFKNKEGGGILITDNWQQSYVFMCPAAAELLDKYESKIFEQADHTDNDGVNKWKTAIHFIK